MRTRASAQFSDPALIPLIYGLLAHDDTARIAAARASASARVAHLEYLRAPQRKGREVLTSMSLEEAA